MSTRTQHKRWTDRLCKRAVRRLVPALLLVCVLGIGLVLRTRHIGDISLSFDESSSWKTVQFSWAGMFDSIAQNVHPPFYYVVLKLWTGLFGDSVVALRGLSVLLGLATILGAYWFVQEAVRGEGGRVLLAALLVAVSAPHVVLSLQARMYALGTFLTVLSGCFLLRAVQSPGSVRDWIGLTIAAAILGLTHYYGLFTVAAAYIFLATELAGEWVSARRRRRESSVPTRTPPEALSQVVPASESRCFSRVWQMLLGTTVSFWVVLNVWGLWWPVFEQQRAQVSESYWIRAFTWDRFARTIWQALTVRRSVPDSAMWAWIAVGVWALTVMLLLLFGRRAGRLAGLSAGLPIILAVAYGLTVRNVLIERYLAFAHLYLLLGWALLLGRVARIGTGGMCQGEASGGNGLQGNACESVAPVVAMPTVDLCAPGEHLEQRKGTKSAKNRFLASALFESLRSALGSRITNRLAAAASHARLLLPCAAALALLAWSGYWSWRYVEHRAFLAGFPGSRAAAAYLDERRQPDEPILVSSPMLHPILQKHLEEKRDIYVIDRGYRYPHFQAGPLLRDCEYFPLDKLSGDAYSRVWAVDASGLFGGVFTVRMPNEYRLVSEQRFPERYRYRMDLIVREYVRQERSLPNGSSARVSDGAE